MLARKTPERLHKTTHSQNGEIQTIDTVDYLNTEY